MPETNRIHDRSRAAGGPTFPATRRLLLALAHPDDEVFLMAGTVRLEANRGTRVTMVMATGGEEGQILNPELRESVHLQDLPRVRQSELSCSMRTLGIAASDRLGYRDSGMAGSESTARPDAFMNVDLDQVVGDVVRAIRRERPQVIVTFDANGGYGHPDHIMIQRATLLAYERAGDAGWYPDAGEPWQPLKLYYQVLGRGSMQRTLAAYERHGERFVFDTGLPGQDDVGSIGAPDEDVTTRIDIRETLDAKRAALRCYASQYPSDFFLLSASDALAREAFTDENFVLVRSEVKSLIPEDDLFASTE